ncbi:MAG TPA: VCBS repeat domain-containing M23 family metallopeptidase [Marmoricola sp.]|nr:VCBS repeat domain-containing M23 family metallopeptidase [Marmoricola sp.]
MRVRRAAAVVGAVAATVALTALPALARPDTDFEMPFPCNQEWTGTSRASHSPSSLNIDWNRPEDLGKRAVAAAAGTVTRVEDLGSRSYGLFLILDHGDGESTLYAHLDAEYVSVGQRVDQGQLIGRVGGSGGVTGPHLHYEQRLDGRAQQAWFGDTAFAMGSTLRSASCVDVPLAGDWTGDGRADLGVFRRNPRGGFLLDHAGTTETTYLGAGTDDPLVGDWDGDGAPDLGVHRGQTDTFTLRSAAGTTKILYGAPADHGIAGDWDGDGVTEVGVWRPRNTAFRLRAADGSSTKVVLGSVGSLPVTGDWNKDGRTDLGVYDDGSWSLWLRRADGTTWSGTVVLGGPGDLPVTGDWNDNRVTDLGVWSPDTATFTLRKAPALSTGPGRIVTQQFGLPR